MKGRAPGRATSPRWWVSLPLPPVTGRVKASYALVSLELAGFSGMTMMPHLARLARKWVLKVMVAVPVPSTGSARAEPAEARAIAAAVARPAPSAARRVQRPIVTDISRAPLCCYSGDEARLQEEK